MGLTCALYLFCNGFEAQTTGRQRQCARESGDVLAIFSNTAANFVWSGLCYQQYSIVR